VCLSYNRLVYLKAAIACYVAQTWRPRELVIVSQGSDRYLAAIRRHLAALARDDIRLVRAAPGLCLGAVRNVGLDAARGAYFCQWDDDDLYHPQRVERQVRGMQAANAEACFLTGCLGFFEHTRSLCWQDCGRLPDPIEHHRWVPQSVLAPVDPQLRYPEHGPESGPGEDNAMRSQVYARRAIGLEDASYLYVYRSHGANFYAPSHYAQLARLTAAPAEWLRPRMSRVRDTLDSLSLPLPIRVVGSQGETVLIHDPR
jgi:glycosyltransferase involved in cell wall biosynthesis